MTALSDAASEQLQLDWLHLARIDGLGGRGVQALARRYGDAAAILRAVECDEAGLGQRYRLPPRAAIEAEFRRIRQGGASVLALPGPAYPALLRQIDSPPPVLIARGRFDLLQRPALALVGARNASALGRKMAALLGHGLAKAGYVVVSGLARGIDTEAHRASLPGGTVAVLAGGLDRPYPPENEALLEEIAQKGVVLSDMPLDHSPRGQDFPRRNRIIAGLALGVVVVEAARRSGSLITARLAAEQGRDVLAVPGSPLDPRCEGSNDLLREGATLVTGTEDVLAALRPLAGDMPRLPGLFREEADAAPFVLDGQTAASPPQPAVPCRRDSPPASGDSLLELLPYEGVDIDELGRMAARDAATLATALLELELAGEVTRLPGNRVARRLM